MQKALYSVLFSVVALSPCLHAQNPPAQTADPVVEQHLPRGVATDITSKEIQALAAKTDPQMPVSDQTLREVPINNGEYNVGVSVVHRATPPGHTPGAFNGGPIEHSDITEIYQFLSGHATFVTGGTILNPKVNPTHGGPGPSVSGTGVENGVTREVGPGDVVIIPPNTPHFFSQIDSQIMYMIYRVDTHHIWDMSGDKKHHQ
jgi:mannose-6-phosphate isomerase-like protein (cupin superfamily)